MEKLGNHPDKFVFVYNPETDDFDLEPQKEVNDGDITIIESEPDPIWGIEL